jgi:hypothetical protein
LLDGGIVSALHSLADGPFGAGVILSLDCALPDHHLLWLFESRSYKPLIV